MRVWDKFLTESDRMINEGSGYGEKAGLGNRPALLIIDVTYAFTGGEDQPLHEAVKISMNSSGHKAWAAIPHIQKLLQHSREKRIPVFYTKHVEPRADKFDMGMWKAKNKRYYKAQGVSEYPQYQIIKEIEPIESDIVIVKKKPSAFFGTPLVSYLNDLGVDSLIICGVATSGCVRASVIDAFSYNYRVAVVEEAVFERLDASHAMALFDMNAVYADVVSTDEVLSYIDTVETGLYDSKFGYQPSTV